MRTVRRGLDRARRNSLAGGTSGPCLAFSRVIDAAEGAGPILYWASCDKDGISGVELRHLRYFVAVAEERHFRRAAERLGIAQPALSQQIQHLERELGGPLLNRTRRSVELTEAGGLFLREANRVLSDAERAAAVVKGARRGEEGRLELG